MVKLLPSNFDSDIRVTQSSACTQAQRDQAIAWLLRLRETPTDPALRQAFTAWLAADPAHPDAYREAEAQWAWMEPFTRQSFAARDAALRYRAARNDVRRRRPAVWAMAASVLLGAGWAVFSPQGWYGWSSTYSAGKGQRLTVTLSDDSHLELNTDTEVRVRYNRNRRHVDLVRGEAFFEVRHDTTRPFSVTAGNLTVRDIGTAFDVYQQSGRVSVAVQEGKVEMAGGQQRRELSAGEQLAYDSDDRFVAAGQTDITAATAWRRGQLLFRGRPLGEVMAEIGRYHDVVIRLRDPKLAGLRVNGNFRTEQLDNLLNAVATLLPVKIKRLGEREIVVEASDTL